MKRTLMLSTLTVLLVAAVLALGACSGDDSERSSEPTGDRTTTYDPPQSSSEDTASTEASPSTEESSMGFSEDAGEIVTMEDYAFDPDSVEIQVGETVTWKNNDPANHTITGAGIDSGRIAQGETFSYTFEEPGTYRYGCSIHPNMTGEITVKE